MTPRERELLEAAKAYREVKISYSSRVSCAFRLDRAIAAYTDNPQAEHEACLARRVAEDGPPPVTDAPGFDGRDGGRMNPINSGAE